MTILDEIFTHKRSEVARQKRLRPLAGVRAEAEDATPARDFVAALQTAPRRPALIAEVKFASPSRGTLVAAPDPLALAEIYRQNGASAISVLTDERYFKGRLDYLQCIAASEPRLPLLRKDFICDEYQVYEARAAGADALLLIVAGLPPDQLCHLQDLALDLGLAALVEVHTEDELETALACGARLVGINNRNLHDFSVSLETTFRLRKHIPTGVTVVAESGIHTGADVARMAEAGVDAILVGEALVTAPDTAARVRELSGGARS